MRTSRFLLLPVLTGLCCLALAACGGGSGGSGSGPSPLPPPDGEGQPGPGPGSSRAGTSYDISVTAVDGQGIAFTVHEPEDMVGGQKYPLLLHGHGFGGSRTGVSQRNNLSPAGTPLEDTLTTRQYTDAGYGVISFDQRGLGQSGGDISLMDPDKDGVNLIQIVDWAESNLDWLMVRDNNLVLGAYGASYGGGYQLLLNNIDPRQRLDAMVPSVTWNDVVYSLNLGELPKSSFAQGLLVAANGKLSPEASTVLMNGLDNNRYSDTDKDYLRYRSNKYFCDGVTQPGKRTASRPPKVDALFFQSMADVVFNLNEARDNYDCLSASGGDVRLYTYVTGHLVPGGAGVPLDGNQSSVDAYRCGPYVADALARLWFDAKLKQDSAAITALAQAPKTCINLGTSGEGVVANAVTTGGGNSIDVPVTRVPQLGSRTMTVPLFTADGTTVVAGIPTATLTLADPTPGSDVDGEDAIVFISIGLIRAGAGPGTLQVLGDQVRPLRGFGTQIVELNGIGAKLAAGDRLLLVLAGEAPAQYPLNPERNPRLPAVNVSGNVQLPVLGNVPTINTSG